MNAGRVLALGLALIAGGCKRNATPADQVGTPAPSPSAVASEAPPVDHLAPGELLEGKEHAFGLTLPRDLGVEGAFPDVVYARGRVAIHPVVRYFRRRLEQGSLNEEETSAVFDHVRVPGKPGTELSIRVLASKTDGTRVEIRDVTPPQLPNLPDDAARWRHAGLTPNGKVADPTHLN